MIWDYMSVAILLEGTSQDFHDLGLHVTRGDILGTTQDFKGRHDEGTSQDMSEYVRNTLTSDGSPMIFVLF